MLLYEDIKGFSDLSEEDQKKIRYYFRLYREHFEGTNIIAFRKPIRGLLTATIEDSVGIWDEIIQ